MSNYFNAYTSGTTSATGFVWNGKDLSGIFAPYVSGDKANATSFYAKVNGAYKDLNEIFARYNPVSNPSFINGGTPTTETTGSLKYYVLHKFTGSGSFTTGVIATGVNDTYHYFVVGAGGKSRDNHIGGAGGGDVLWGTFNPTSNTTYNVTVGLATGDNGQPSIISGVVTANGGLADGTSLVNSYKAGGGGDSGNGYSGGSRYGGSGDTVGGGGGGGGAGGNGESNYNGTTLWTGQGGNGVAYGGYINSLMNNTMYYGSGGSGYSTDYVVIGDLPYRHTDSNYGNGGKGNGNGNRTQGVVYVCYKPVL